MSSQVVADITTYSAVELANLPTAMPEFCRADGTPTMSRDEAESLIRRYPTHPRHREVHAAYGGKPLPVMPPGTDPALWARYPKMLSPPPS
jgi:hypothetical protein